MRCEIKDAAPAVMIELTGEDRVEQIAVALRAQLLIPAVGCASIAGDPICDAPKLNQWRRRAWQSRNLKICLIRRCSGVIDGAFTFSCRTLIGFSGQNRNAPARGTSAR